MITARARKAKVKLVALVRDSKGNPKVDNYPNILPEMMSLLTQKDKEYLECR